MRRCVWLLLMAGWSVACGSSANVAQERDTLLRLDREWSDSVKDLNKFLSYYAADASVYPPGMLVATGSGAIRDVITKIGRAHV